MIGLESGRAGRSVMLVGGGRWAGVLAEELARRDDVVALHWVSERNTAGAQERAAALRPRCSVEIEVWPSLDDCIAATDPDAAVVANLPADHVATALRCLQRGIATLVEKPLATSSDDLHRLLAAARATDVPVAAGLEFLTSPAVHALAGATAELGDAPVSEVECRWEDPAREPSHFDATIDVVRDLVPHVLSMLTVVLGPARVADERVVTGDGGWSADVRFRYGPVPVRVRLARGTATQCRRFVVHREDRSARLDFGRDPVVEVVAGESVRPVPFDGSVSPIAAELGAFFALTDGVPHPIALDQTAELHEDVERLAAASAAARRTEAAGPFRLRAIAPDLLPALVSCGLVPHPRDRVTADRWLTAAADVIATFAADPFATQADVARRLDVGTGELRTLNRVLRDAPLAQDLMVGSGAGAKYWTNTIIPLVRSGSIGRTLRGEAALPFRIGVYPGASCMFFCTFCGRNTDARYDRHDLPAGNQLFRALLEGAPADDPHRFYLSGGLEPLTNPGLGELVVAGADRGFDLSLYTNGQMLTPTLLARQPGLDRLATVRVSLYGVDEAAQDAVTGKPNSFRQVTANLLQFLRHRDERRTTTSVGLNYVVLPGRVDDVVRLFDLVADLNRQVDRPLDFVTLREDFSVDPDAGITGAERSRLADLFGRVEDRRAGDLAGVTIDYGYALDTLRRGLPGTPLRYVTDDEIRPFAFPQVSVVVDLLGDVYLYREAGFLDRPGADRYIIGRITDDRSLEDVVAAYLSRGQPPVGEPGDTRYFDIFDHVVTQVLNQAEADAGFGIPFEQGPVAARAAGDAAEAAVLAHPTLL